MEKRRFFIHLTSEELKALERFMQRATGKKQWRARKRAQVVYFSYKSKTPAQIALELKLSIRSVYSHLRSYRQKGIKGLAEPIRPMKLSAQQVTQLTEISYWAKIVSNKKQDIMDLRKRWSFRKMAQWVFDEWQIKLSSERIRQIVYKKIRTYP